MKHLIESCGATNLQPFTIIFDRSARIRACIDQQNFETEKMKRLLSKITFNTSMDEYLSERTFLVLEKSTMKILKTENNSLTQTIVITYKILFKFNIQMIETGSPVW